MRHVGLGGFLVILRAESYKALSVDVYLQRVNRCNQGVHPEVAFLASIQKGVWNVLLNNPPLRHELLRCVVVGVGVVVVVVICFGREC